VTNDPSIILRKLMMKIYYFEISRNNDIRISDTIDEIEGIGSEAESKIHEKFKENNDVGIFKENLMYLEECCNKSIYLCRRKGIEINIEKKPIERSRKEGFFKNLRQMIELDAKEEKFQEKMFSQLRGVQKVKKKAMIQWMETKIKEADEK
jgi:hypothetical protein